MRRLKSEYDSLPLAESKMALILGACTLVGLIVGGIVWIANVFAPVPGANVHQDHATQNNDDSNAVGTSESNGSFQKTDEAMREFSEGQSAK